MSLISNRNILQYIKADIIEKWIRSKEIVFDIAQEQEFLNLIEIDIIICKDFMYYFTIL